MANSHLSQANKGRRRIWINDDCFRFWRNTSIIQHLLPEIGVFL